MIVQCAACQTRFKIADEKVTDRGVKVRCSKCSTTFVVRKDQGVTPSELPPGVRLQTVLPLQSELPSAAPGPTRPPPGWSEPSPPSAGDPFASDLTLKVPDPFAAAARDLNASLPSPGLGAPGMGWGSGDPFTLPTPAPTIPTGVPAGPAALGGPPLAGPPLAGAPFSARQTPLSAPTNLPPAVQPSRWPNADLFAASPSAPPAPPLATPRTADDVGLNSSIFSTSPAVSASVRPPGADELAAAELKTGAQPLDFAGFGARGAPPPPVGSQRPGGGAVIAAISLNTRMSSQPAAAPPPASAAVDPRPTSGSRSRKKGSRNAPGPAVSAEAIAAARAVMRAQKARRNKRRSPVARVARTMVVALLGVALIALAVVIFGEPAPAAPALTVRQIATGLYDTRPGRAVLYVRGTVANGSLQTRPIQVRVELRRGSTVTRTASATAGAVPTPEELFEVANPASLAQLNEALALRAKPVERGGAAPFLAVFYEYPDDYGSLDVHVEPMFATPIAPPPKPGGAVDEDEDGRGEVAVPAPAAPPAPAKREKSTKRTGAPAKSGGAR